MHFVEKLINNPILFLNTSDTYDKPREKEYHEANSKCIEIYLY